MSEDSGKSDVVAELERVIMLLLQRRDPASTICPSDAARVVGREDDWRTLMDRAREAAGRLVRTGEVEITQGGEVVDLSTATGPIRIRRVRQHRP